MIVLSFRISKEGAIGGKLRIKVVTNRGIQTGLVEVLVSGLDEIADG